MDFNVRYLDKTANKWPRLGGLEQIQTVVWHETASPNPSNPHGTLSYNLAKKVQSSYNYLIARDGTIFHYVNEREWIAYHAGVQSSARGYAGWEVNVHSLGVELDGRNDGTPITQKQRAAAIELIKYFSKEYKIPIERAYHLHHKEVAPGYKTDPRGYSVDKLLELWMTAAATPADHCPGGLHYVVKTNAARLRQGPGTKTPIVTTMQAGETFIAKDIVVGETITLGATTDSRWAHRADDLGFMWLGLLKKP